MRYKPWVFRIVEDRLGNRLNSRYPVSCGPGAYDKKENIIIEEYAQDAIRTFVKKVQADPKNGGWQSGPPNEVEIWPLDDPEGKSRFRIEVDTVVITPVR